MTLLFYNINVSFILYYLLMNYILIMLLIFFFGLYWFRASAQGHGFEGEWEGSLVNRIDPNTWSIRTLRNDGGKDGI